jgi:hypothetical protein
VSLEIEVGSHEFDELVKVSVWVRFLEPATRIAVAVFDPATYGDEIGLVRQVPHFAKVTSSRIVSRVMADSARHL